MPGIDVPILKVGIAGLIGAGSLFAVLYGVTGAVSRRRRKTMRGKKSHPTS